MAAGQLLQGLGVGGQGAFPDPLQVQQAGQCAGQGQQYRAGQPQGVGGSGSHGLAILEADFPMGVVGIQAYFGPLAMTCVIQDLLRPTGKLLDQPDLAGVAGQLRQGAGQALQIEDRQQGAGNRCLGRAAQGFDHVQHPGAADLLGFGRDCLAPLGAADHVQCGEVDRCAGILDQIGSAGEMHMDCQGVTQQLAQQLRLAGLVAPLQRRLQSRAGRQLRQVRIQPCQCAVEATLLLAGVGLAEALAIALRRRGKHQQPEQRQGSGQPGEHQQQRDQGVGQIARLAPERGSLQLHFGCASLHDPEIQ